MEKDGTLTETPNKSTCYSNMKLYPIPNINRFQYPTINSIKLFKFLLCLQAKIFKGFTPSFATQALLQDLLTFSP